MEEFGACVVAAADSGTPLGLIGAVDSYLAIHDRVAAWPEQLGAGSCAPSRPEQGPP